VSWNGKDEHSIKEIDAPRLDRLQTFLKARPDPPLRFTARGGLGVYVEGGSASFRNLRIVPRATD
jgi:hypothetical protein